MARRPFMRPNDLKTALAVLKEAGVEPAALDIMPNGTHRWHFTKPSGDDEDDLDRELAAFEARHGHG